MHAAHEVYALPGPYTGGRVRLDALNSCNVFERVAERRLEMASDVEHQHTCGINHERED